MGGDLAEDGESLTAARAERVSIEVFPQVFFEVEGGTVIENAEIHAVRGKLDLDLDRDLGGEVFVSVTDGVGESLREGELTL